MRHFMLVLMDIMFFVVKTISLVFTCKNCPKAYNLLISHLPSSLFDPFSWPLQTISTIEAVSSSFIKFTGRKI